MSVVSKVREPSAKYLVANFPSLLRDFELVATASGAVANLRKLILALAVGGKLVVQNLNDEPARKALARSLVERQALRSLRSGKPNRYLLDAPLASGDEGVLPRGWVKTQIGQLLISIKSGGTPSKENPSYWDGDIPWASVKDLKFGAPIFNTQDKITEVGLVAGAALAEKGSIIICTRMGLGKIGEAMIDIAINQDLKAIKLGSCIDKNYFIIFFQTLKIVGSGMTVAGIKQEELLAYPILLPPLAEQRRIVARVEELMKLCDALEARGRLADEQHARLTSTLFDALAASESAHALAENWQRIAKHFDLLLDRPEAIDALEQTILQLAVRGALVAQNESEESAAELVARIKAMRQKRHTDGEGKLPKPAESIQVGERPVTLPQGWCLVRLSQVADSRLGKMLDKAKNTGAMRPYLRNTNVQWRRFALDDVKSLRLESRELNEFRVRDGDLLVCEGGEPGRCAIWRDAEIEMYFQKAIHRVRPLGGVLSEYVEICLQQDAQSGALGKYFTGATIKHFAAQELIRYVLPLPPVAEQHRLVARVEELRHLCAQLRERLTFAQRTQSQLAEALVDEVA